jgi:hypothetical protein
MFLIIHNISFRLQELNMFLDTLVRETSHFKNILWSIIHCLGINNINGGPSGNYLHRQRWDPRKTWLFICAQSEVGKASKIAMPVFRPEIQNIYSQ